MAIPAEILHGELPLIIAQDLRLGGPGALDSASYRVLCPWPDYLTALREAGFTAGRQVAGLHRMFVQSTGISGIGGAVCEVEVECAGLAAMGDKRLRRVATASQQVSVGPFEKVVVVWDTAEQGTDPDSGQPVDRAKRAIPKLDATGQPLYELIVTPAGAAERWNIHEAVITVTDTYFSIVPLVTTGVGRPAEPPNAPAVPAFQWGGYDRPVRHNSPSGWVLVSREVSDVGPGLWAVTDGFGYYHPYLPD